MLFPLKKRLVNWVDGMKISKKHLSQTEDYFMDIVRDAVNIRLNSYNYGLLPPYRGDKISSNFEIMERTTNHVEIELRRCNAITAGGCRIDINPRDYTGYMKLDHVFANREKNGKENLWDVILIVHPFGRVPVGVPDPDETPPRHPYADKTYSLSITPSGQINAEELGMHNLIIGRIIQTPGNRFEVDHRYIPPCMSMMSHPDLKEYYEVFGKYLNDIEVSSHKIIQKILERDKPMNIAVNTQFMCEHILNYVVSIYFKYKNMGRNFSPVEITDIFASFAHICFITLNFIPKKKREEMLQYFYEWSDVTPGNFVDLLTNVLESVYDHHNIRAGMERIDTLLSMLSSLLLKLSSLEYIGQHRENVVVAVQNPKEEKVVSRSSWTILD
ncbi:MAG: type VI secretion system baseplate subunit TssK [Bacteroidales bacterium]|jgi:predicted component of type VI protein secretion system|nr:type VI secretion system baseplate subunit TssK [Bacteroidales bacterium]